MFKLLVILTIFVFCNESRHLYNRQLSGRSLRPHNFKYYYLLREPPRDFDVFFDLLAVPPSGTSKRNCALPSNTCDYDFECPSSQKCCEDTFCDFKVCKSVSNKSKVITKKPEAGNEVLKEQECSFPCVECVLFDIKCNFDYNCPPCYSCCEEQCKHVNQTTTESSTNSEDILPSSIKSTTDFFPSSEIEENSMHPDLSTSDQESVSKSTFTTQTTTTAMPTTTRKISTLPPSVATKIPQSSIEYTTDLFSSLEPEDSNMPSDLSTSDQESVSKSTYTTQTTKTTAPTTTRKINTRPPSVSTKIPQSSIEHTTNLFSSLKPEDSNLSSDLSTSDQESVSKSTYTTQTTKTTAPTTTRKISTRPSSVSTKIPQSSIDYTTDFVSSLETNESNLSSELSTSNGERVTESTYTTQTTTTVTPRTTRIISTLSPLVTTKATKPTTILKPSTISVIADKTTGFIVSSTNRGIVDTEFSTVIEISGSGSGDDDDDEDLDVYRTLKTTRPTTTLKPSTKSVTTGFIISSTKQGTVDTEFSTATKRSGSGSEDGDVIFVSEDLDVYRTSKATRPTTTLKPSTKSVTTGFIISSTNRGTVDTEFSTAKESNRSGSRDGDDDEDLEVYSTTKTTKKEDDDAFFFSKDISTIFTDQPHDKKGKRDDGFEFSNSTTTDKNKQTTSVFATPTVHTFTSKDLSYTSTSNITLDEIATSPRSVTEKTQKPTNISISATTISSNNDPSTAKPSTTSDQKRTTIVPAATVHTINSQPPSNSTTPTIKSNITAEFNTGTTKEVSSAATATASAKSGSKITTSTITFTKSTTRFSTLSNTPTSIITEEGTLSLNGSNLITTTSNVVSTEYISSIATLKGEEGSGDLIDREESGETIINTLIDQENGSGSGSGDDNDDEDLQKGHTKSENTKEWGGENKSTVKPELEAKKEEEESDYESIDKIIEPKIQSGNLVDSDYYVIIDDLDVPKFNIKRSEKLKAKEKNKRNQKIS